MLGEVLVTEPEVRVWVVDDDESLRWVLEKALSAAAMQVRSFDGAAGAWETHSVSTAIRQFKDVVRKMRGSRLVRPNQKCPQFIIRKCAE